MPGRPRTTLKLLNELLVRAGDYGNELFNLMPAQYQDQPDSDDPTSLAWRQATRAAVENYRALDELRQLLAEKVGRSERRAAGKVRS